MNDAPPIGSVMLIDDSATDVWLSRRLIERSGLADTFIGYQSAEEALDFLAESKLPAVDAILLDINMPRMNGFEFLDAAMERLGKNFTRIVVMMLTTSLDPQDRERAGQYPMVRDFCNKPLVIQHLENLAAMLGEDTASQE